MSAQLAEFSQKERADAYDQKFAKLSPTRDSLHLLMHTAFSDLPPQAHVLVVGAGTGAELLDLAAHFPQWRFTVVEPAPAMLDICRYRVQERGLANRCALHSGYLDSLPASQPFDGATSILVSQFLMNPDARRGFFEQIAARLRPQGTLVSADLCLDPANRSSTTLLEMWRKMLRGADILAEEVEKMVATFGQQTAVLPVEQVEALIAAGGFDSPVLFYQNLLIHAWYARRLSEI